MEFGVLSRTCDAHGQPNRRYANLYSTEGRLRNLLMQSVELSYIGLTYNMTSSVFINTIYGDLVYELAAIKSAEYRKVDNWGMYIDSEVMVDNQDAVLATCSMMLNRVTYVPKDIDNVIRLLLGTYGDAAGFMEAVIRFRTSELLISMGNAAEPFVVSALQFPAIRRHGMSAVFSFHSDFIATFEYDPTRVGDIDLPITKFMSCTIFPDTTLDTYAALLGQTCVEPWIETCTASSELDKHRFALAIFANEQFVCHNAAAVIARITKATDWLTSDDYRNMSKVLQHLTEIRKVTRAVAGPSVKSMLENISTVNFGESTRNYIKYLLGVLSDPQVHGGDEVATAPVAADLESFKDTLMYDETLDVTSNAYITPIAVGDVSIEALSDGEETDDKDEPEEDPSEEPDEDEEEPEEDPGDEEEPEEEPAEKPPVVQTDDKKGFVLEVSTHNDTLDTFLYRREIGKLITSILSNPPEDVADEDLAILKHLKNNWLELLTPKSIHGIITGLVSVKIKVTEHPQS